MWVKSGRNHGRVGEDIIQFLSEELNGIKGIEMIHIYTKGKRREINGQGRVELVAPQEGWDM